MSSYSMYQDFNWHDVAGNYDYAFGEDGYMKMDGSNAGVQCYRYLKEKITGSKSSLEAKMRVVLDVPEGQHPYAIVLYDSGDQRVASCVIRRDGRVFFQKGSEYVDSGKVLTFQGGRPFNDLSLRKWYVVESDEHAFIFRNFDFGNGTFDFALDDGDAVKMPFNVSGGDISKLELRTNGIGIGRMIRLRHYKQYVKDELVDLEEFPVHWKPVPPPADGMPDDNICESRLRPVGNRWLELSTKYGFVIASIPAMPKGTLEFEVKTPNVEQEACIILGEYDGTIKCYRKIQTGILSGRIPIATDTGNRGFQNFDDPITPVNNEVYKFKIAWDKSTNKQRIWVNDIPQKYNGAYDIEIYGDWSLPKHLTRGIDAITLHPGHLGTVRATSLQKAKGIKEAEDVGPLVTHWGKFRLYP